MTDPPLENITLAVQAVQEATGQHPWIISHSDYFALPEGERASHNGRPYLVLQDDTYARWKAR